jgi:hypothetical protein
MRLFLHRLLGRHVVERYTDSAYFTRGVCWCGVEGDLDMYGRFN